MESGYYVLALTWLDWKSKLQSIYHSRLYVPFERVKRLTRSKNTC